MLQLLMPSQHKTTRAHRYWLLLLGAVAVAGPLSAQSDPRGTRATRSELETLATEAERRSTSGDLGAGARADWRVEARRLRERLQDGDILVGDRIVMAVVGEESLTDTFTVRAGRTLRLPDMDDVSLQGVLRSELHERLSTHIGRYLRNPSVQVTALVRVAVLGEVRNPNFYAVAADVPLSDLLSVAGGLSQFADVSRTTVRRGGVELVPAPIVSVALADGTTLDQLGLRGGDEVLVGRRRQVNWSSIISSAAVLVGAVATMVALSR